MIKLLIGGSPCTYWSIAQKKNRETEPSGIGWELFENYLIAKEKFKPDFFLYENNVSASKPIKDEIKRRFDVGESANNYIEINSALVSAQNRKRFYVHNCGDVGQPNDRGVLLRDILETGTDLTQNEKAYCLTASYNGAVAFNTLERKQITMIAEPVRIGDIGSTNQASRVYSCDSKSVSLKANAGGQGGKTGLYACPVMRVREATKQGFAEIKAGECVDLSQENSKTRRGRAMKDKSNCLTTSNAFYEYCGTVDKPVYKVKNGKIEIKGQEYPIKLKDGYYIIRKLTVTECCRLQTLPDDYCRAVSKTQAYKGLGNGWTAEVIIHILNGALKDIPRDEKIVVFSMYDGIGTGRYCLDKMGFKNVEYHAFEVDKYAIQIAQSNYPDIIEHGDAYQVRDGLNFIYGVHNIRIHPGRIVFRQPRVNL